MREMKLIRSSVENKFEKVSAESFQQNEMFASMSCMLFCMYSCGGDLEVTTYIIVQHRQSYRNVV